MTIQADNCGSYNMTVIERGREMATKLHSWFMNANVHSRADMRLFCFPYAGGGASIYRDWLQLLPKEIEVCPVQLPGRENRGLEAPMCSLPEIVQAVADEIGPLLNLPFALFGHSMGALLAYETARQLDRKYNKTPLHLFVSGHSAPHLPHSGRKLYSLSDQELIHELRILRGTPEAILQNDELMVLLLPRLRADFQVCETYSFFRDNPIACPITALGGIEDHDVSMDNLAAWGELTQKETELQLLSGDHFFLHNEQEVIVQLIKDRMHHANKKEYTWSGGQ